MKISVTILFLMMLLTSCTGVQALCRHQVLAQYAAFKDAGYEAEIWHMKNLNPEDADGFKYHVALRVKVGSDWQWVKQPVVAYETTTQAPPNTILLRKMQFGEVSGWVEKGRKEDERR